MSINNDEDVPLTPAQVASLAIECYNKGLRQKRPRMDVDGNTGGDGKEAEMVCGHRVGLI